jgi:hypothetical protein
MHACRGNLPAAAYLWRVGDVAVCVEPQGHDVPNGPAVLLLA